VPDAPVASIADVAPIHIVAGVAVTVTVGFGLIVIVICARGPSQPGAATVFCETQKFCVPAVPVVGVGAVVLGVPPVAVVYHCNVCDASAVACTAVAVAPTQYSNVCAGITGAAGDALITTVVVTAGEVHPFTVVVKLYVPASATVDDATVGFCTE
jgi:hypothetical protein